jgi:hypothetical protein
VTHRKDGDKKISILVGLAIEIFGHHRVGDQNSSVIARLVTKILFWSPIVTKVALMSIIIFLHMS